LCGYSHTNKVTFASSIKHKNMTTIDPKKPVLVTGATGYVAAWLIKKLLDEGITVHAAVRNPDSKKKTAHLDALAANSPGIIRYFKSDLLDMGSYEAGMEGCELVYHTASPFTSDFKDAQKDLIDPAQKGTANVLESAKKVASVKRVVVTSSCAAIYTDAIDCVNAPNGKITEEIWNTTASLEYQPYSYSKTVAEQKAWEIAKSQSQWDLVTINPSFVMGPPLNPQATTSESFSILKQMGDGTFKTGAPKLGIGVVDVRDVAEAHYQAGFNPAAQGRYITSAHNTNFLEMSLALKDKFGAKFPIAKSAAPKWLLMLVGPFINKTLSRKFLRNNINVAFNADNSKIKKELGLKFRPLQQTMEDGFQVLVDEKIV
jgi:nucleoside-diphosphate-sugar epimerase